METHRIYKMSFGKVYPLYITKAEKKGRTKNEVDEIIRWLTGYSQKQLEAQIVKETDFETFFSEATKLNSNRKRITGIICGVRVEEIKEPLMQEIRYKKVIDAIKKRCERSNEKLKTSELPQFNTPRSVVSSASLSSFEKVAGTGLAIAGNTHEPSTEADQLYRINLNRYAKNRPPSLTRLGCADKMAQNWSRFLAGLSQDKAVLAHTPNMAATFKTFCGNLNWKILGENVGYGRDSSQLFGAFKSSKGHYDNILNRSYNRIGLGAYRVGPARVFVTHNFIGL